jgi:hypothetical protein
VTLSGILRRGSEYLHTKPEAQAAWPGQDTVVLQWKVKSLVEVSRHGWQWCLRCSSAESHPVKTKASWSVAVPDEVGSGGSSSPPHGVGRHVVPSLPGAGWEVSGLWVRLLSGWQCLSIAQGACLQDDVALTQLLWARLGTDRFLSPQSILSSFSYS